MEKRRKIKVKAATSDKKVSKLILHEKFLVKKKFILNEKYLIENGVLKNLCTSAVVWCMAIL